LKKGKKIGSYPFEGKKKGLNTERLKGESRRNWMGKAQTKPDDGIGFRKKGKPTRRPIKRKARRKTKTEAPFAIEQSKLTYHFGFEKRNPSQRVELESAKKIRDCTLSRSTF